MQMWPLSNGDPKAKFTIKICSTSDSINAIYANTGRTNKIQSLLKDVARMYEIEGAWADLDNLLWGKQGYMPSHKEKHNVLLGQCWIVELAGNVCKISHPEGLFWEGGGGDFSNKFWYIACNVCMKCDERKSQEYMKLLLRVNEWKQDWVNEKRVYCKCTQRSPVCTEQGALAPPFSFPSFWSLKVLKRATLLQYVGVQAAQLCAENKLRLHSWGGMPTLITLL